MFPSSLYDPPKIMEAVRVLSGAKVAQIEYSDTPSIRSGKDGVKSTSYWVVRAVVRIFVEAITFNYNWLLLTSERYSEWVNNDLETLSDKF